MKDFTKGEFFWLHASSSIKLYEMINEKRNRPIKKKLKPQRKFTRALALKNRLDVNLKNTYAVLLDKTLSSLFEFLLLEMDKFKFDTSTSVNQTTHKFGLDIDLEKLTDVNLKFHTFGVFNYGCNLDVAHINSIKDYIVLACLVHDFGKSLLLCQEYGLDPSKPHHEISAAYLRKIIRKFRYTNFQVNIFEMVIAALNMHHAQMSSCKIKLPAQKEISLEVDPEVITQLILSQLKKCDLRQRQYEVANFKNILEYQKYCKVKKKSHKGTY